MNEVVFEIDVIIRAIVLIYTLFSEIYATHSSMTARFFQTGRLIGSFSGREGKVPKRIICRVK